MRRLALRLLAEIAPDRRTGRADRLAQRLRRDMAVADLDRNRIGLDDDVLRLVLFRARQRRGGRGRVGPHGGAVEVLAPASVGGLKHDNAIREAAGGDDIRHRISRSGAGRRFGTHVADYTANLYN